MRAKLQLEGGGPGGQPNASPSGSVIRHAPLMGPGIGLTRALSSRRFSQPGFMSTLEPSEFDGAEAHAQVIYGGASPSPPPRLSIPSHRTPHLIREHSSFSSHLLEWLTDRRDQCSASSALLRRMQCSHVVGDPIR